MRCIAFNHRSIDEINCINSLGVGKGVEVKKIPIIEGHIDWLPEKLQALILMSDLQCYDIDGVLTTSGKLVAETVMEKLLESRKIGICSTLERVGIVLAGDFYAAPGLDRRGGLGDVQQVWYDFAWHCRWVTGVAGNHDQFYGQSAFPAQFTARKGVYPLNGNVACLDNELRVAGISGILGKPGKPWRHNLEQFSNMLNNVLEKKPHILILHEGPNWPEEHLRGNPVIRDLLENIQQPMFVICGHRHWVYPLAQLNENIQVLNVDSRVVMLRRLPN